jgi:hypothetical protein
LKGGLKMEEILNKENNRESIKLMKMSKGYQWEIRVFGSGIKSGKIMPSDVEHLEFLDKKLKEKWEQEKTENTD